MNIKRLFAIIMLAFIMISMLSSCSLFGKIESEPNNSAEKADAVDLDVNIKGTINTSDNENLDQDWFSFKLKKMTWVDLSLTTANVSNLGFPTWGIIVYGEDRSTALARRTASGNNDIELELGALPEGTYYVMVTGNCLNKSKMSYTMLLEKNHECAFDWVLAYEPTCVDEGYEYYACKICKAERDVRPIPATGHECDNWEVEIKPTCTKEGLRHGICSVCDEVVEDTMPKSFHLFNDWEVVSGNVIVPPIVKEHKCQECGYTETIKDWGYVWVTVLAGIAAIGVCFGIVAYIKAYKNP